MVGIKTIAAFFAIISICAISVSAQCVYTVSGTSGGITSPNYPYNYDNSMDCNYTITTPENTVVFLDIVDLHAEAYYDIVTIYDGPTVEDQLLNTFSGNYEDVRINGSNNQILITFTSDFSNTRKGFNITFISKDAGPCGEVVNGSSGYIQSPNYPNNYDDNMNCTYLISTSEDTAITLTVMELDLETGCDFLDVYDGPTIDSNLIRTFSGHESSGYPVYASSNEVLFHFHTDISVQHKGFYINFTERAPCGGNLFGTYGAIISPGYPVEPYPNNLNCYYTVTTSEGTTVALDIVDMQTEDYYDYIQIYDGSSGNPYVANYTGDHSNETFYATTNHVTIYFHTDSSEQDIGFFISYYEMEAETICPASIYTGDSGLIVSPFYPEKYPNNVDCSYIITTSKNTQILLHTSKLEMEHSIDCSKDYVEFFDGLTADATRLAKFCGSESVHDIVSSSNIVYVHFHSDSESESNGFSITYSASPPALDDNQEQIYEN